MFSLATYGASVINQQSSDSIREPPPSRALISQRLAGRIGGYVPVPLVVIFDKNS